MRRVRLTIAIILATAMMSFGATACTPEEEASFGTGIGQVIGLVITLVILGSAPPCPNGVC